MRGPKPGQPQCNSSPYAALRCVVVVGRNAAKCRPIATPHLEIIPNDPNGLATWLSLISWVDATPTPGDRELSATGRGHSTCVGRLHTLTWVVVELLPVRNAWLGYAVKVDFCQERGGILPVKARLPHYSISSSSPAPFLSASPSRPKVPALSRPLLSLLSSPAPFASFLTPNDDGFVLWRYPYPSNLTEYTYVLINIAPSGDRRIRLQAVPDPSTNYTPTFV